MKKFLGIALVSLALAAGGSQASAQSCSDDDLDALQCGGDSLGTIVDGCLQSQECVIYLLMGDTPGLVECTAQCFADTFPTVTTGCVGCFRDLAECGLEAAVSTGNEDCAACATGLCSPSCLSCVEESGCRADFDACTGGTIADYCEAPTCG
ncbi:MAG: hypothetical protein AAGF92_20795 [Myxococcota bacterium]